MSRHTTSHRTDRTVGRRRARPDLESLEARQLLATFTVLSAGDSGLGSLRQAILDANTQPGADSIRFAIVQPGQIGGVTIALMSPLPTITDPVTIDGTTELNSANAARDVIDGALAGAGAIGFRITAGGSTIRGLDIRNFRAAGGSADPFGAGGSAIELAGGGGNLVEGNLLGADAPGAVAGFGNTFGVHVVNSPNNTIGGIIAAAGNAITGNRSASEPAAPRSGAGVVIEGPGSTGNVVAGNSIGGDAPNGSGVIISSATGNRVGGLEAGSRNNISKNASFGVWLRGTASGNVVEGNFFGVDPSGANPSGRNRDQIALAQVTNQADIAMTDGASRNTIGGVSPAAGNLIAALNVGVALSGPNVTGNLVEGNFIGVNSAGTRALVQDPFAPSGFPIGTGIELSGPGNTIGGASGIVRNIISGLTYGIHSGRLVSDRAVLAASLLPLDLSGSVVAGNLIGTDATGDRPVPNGAGVTVEYGASGLRIGGDADGEGNVIAFNTQAGVFVNVARLVTIRGNPFFENGVGIQLNAANDAVPTPDLLTRTEPNPQGFRVFTGTVLGKPGTAYRIDFYSSPTATPSGHGQGRTPLGAGGNYTAGPDGHANFLLALLLPSDQPYLTATATDPAGNTSEFSNAIPTPPSAVGFEHLIKPSVAVVGQDVTYLFTVVNAGAGPATGVVVTAPVPSSIAFKKVTTGAGTSSFANGVATVNIGDLAAGGRVQIGITGTALTLGIASVVATVTASDLAPVPPRNTETQSFDVVPATPTPSDLLSISQTASPEPVTVGGSLVYTIVVRNVGGVDADGVQVFDNLLTGGMLLAATPSQGTVTAAADLVTANLGHIAAGGTATLTLIVRPTLVGAYTNTAKVTSTTVDPNPLNNTTTFQSTVVAALLIPEGPRIVNLQRLGYHNLPTSLVLTFNMPLDTAHAQDVHNYVLNATTEDGRHTFRPTHRIAILSAVYDPIANTVTLRPASRLDLHRAYQLTVSGAPFTGLREAHGVPLDGAGTGRGGSDYAATFLGFNVIAIGNPPAKSKVAPHHLATKHAAPLPKGATLFGHPDVLASRRNPR